VPKLAPEPLRTVQRFVNTVDHEHGREWLSSPAELADWLGAHGFALSRRLSRAELGRALELREALRALARGNRGDAVAADALATVNEIGRTARLAPELRRDVSVALRADARGTEGAFGQLVAIVFGAILDGSWGRLKPCRQCNWLFYDYSRNRAATWCSMSICGNRRKTRAYRARKLGG
jgi:predicted RNA-binding Zn ribbon-like protein